MVMQQAFARLHHPLATYRVHQLLLVDKYLRKAEALVQALQLLNWRKMMQLPKMIMCFLTLFFADVTAGFFADVTAGKILQKLTYALLGAFQFANITAHCGIGVQPK